MADFPRLLVTGGAGFIGSQYVRMAARGSGHVTVLDKLTYAGNVENLRDVRDRITFIQGDIGEPADVEKAMAGADAVLTFAAESHVDRSLMDSRPFVRTNVEGTLVLLEAARRLGVKRFLQVSTDEVYGDLHGKTHTSREGDVLAPRSPYAATKAAAEHLVMSYGVGYGLDVVLTRGSNTYGPYQFPEKIIPLFITNAIEDKPLPLYGQGKALRDYLHVEDHATGIDLVLREGRRGRAYNLGARVQAPGTQVAQRVLACLNKPQTLAQFVPDRPGHDYRYEVDPSDAEALGWQRRWDFPTGLAQTVQWYLNNHGWWQPLKHAGAFRDYEKTWYTDRK